MEHFLIILGTFGYCVASAVIPIFHAEAYLVAASLLAPPELRWPLVVAAATGQMIGKTAMYFAGRGALLIPGERMQRRIQQATERYRAKGEIGGALVFLSSASGFPPFYIVSIAAGMLKYPLPPFLVLGLAGRFIRFSVAVFLPQLLKG
jgi:membrane protein YqaA with SNARE-associated domain